MTESEIHNPILARMVLTRMANQFEEDIKKRLTEAHE